MLAGAHPCQILTCANLLTSGSSFNRTAMHALSRHLYACMRTPTPAGKQTVDAMENDDEFGDYSANVAATDLDFGDFSAFEEHPAPNPHQQEQPPVGGGCAADLDVGKSLAFCR